MLAAPKLGTVSIALIVSAGERPLFEAERYVAVLPTHTALYLYAAAEHRRALKDACHDAGVPVQMAENAPHAVRMAEIVVIFGESPFGQSDVDLLASQGIPVEHSKAKVRRKKGRAA